MSDLGIFMFGCVVFGVAITSTLVVVLAPASSERERERGGNVDGRDEGRQAA